MKVSAADKGSGRVESITIVSCDALLLRAVSPYNIQFG